MIKVNNSVEWQYCVVKGQEPKSFETLNGIVGPLFEFTLVNEKLKKKI